MNIWVVVASDGLIWEGPWEAGLVPACVIGASIPALRWVSHKETQRFVGRLTGMSMAQGMREYAVITALRKLLRSVLT